MTVPGNALPLTDKAFLSPQKLQDKASVVARISCQALAEDSAALQCRVMLFPWRTMHSSPPQELRDKASALARITCHSLAEDMAAT